MAQQVKALTLTNAADNLSLNFKIHTMEKQSHLSQDGLLASVSKLWDI